MVGDFGNRDAVPFRQLEGDFRLSYLVFLGTRVLDNHEHVGLQVKDQRRLSQRFVA